MTKQEQEDRVAIQNLREIKAARGIERIIDLRNKAYWVAAGNTLQEGYLFTGTRALKQEA